MHMKPYFVCYIDASVYGELCTKRMMNRSRRHLFLCFEYKEILMFEARDHSYQPPNCLVMGSFEMIPTYYC